MFLLGIHITRYNNSVKFNTKFFSNRFLNSSLIIAASRWLPRRWLLLRWLLLEVVSYIDCYKKHDIYSFYKVVFKWLLLIISLNGTPLEKIGCLGNPYFRHPVFWFTLFPTKSVRLSLVTYPSLCITCMTYRIPSYAISHQVLPTQGFPREGEDYPRGNKHFKHFNFLLTKKVLHGRFCLRVRVG